MAMLVYAGVYDDVAKVSIQTKRLFTYIFMS
jgi:hypothetical protein